MARHLAQASGFEGTWALAGRDRAKLERVAASLSSGAGAQAPGILVADVSSPDSLASMARAARLLISTVG